MRLPFFSKLARPSSPEAEEDSAHVHEWDLVAKTFVEPKPHVSIANNDQLTKLSLTGVTTLLFQCSSCSAFRKEELPGLEQTALDRLLDKVDVGGPEFVVRDATTYVLMKHPDSNHPQGLPIRK